MKLLANENIPLDSVLLLREWGYDILSIGEENPSISDSEVIKAAIEEERVILTFDRDYGELIFRKGLRPPKGVIYLRIEPVNSHEPAEIIDTLMKTKGLEFSSCITVVHRNFVRQRKF